jgi:hypothetical protein
MESGLVCTVILRIFKTEYNYAERLVRMQAMRETGGPESSAAGFDVR